MSVTKLDTIHRAPCCLLEAEGHQQAGSLPWGAKSRGRERDRPLRCPKAVRDQTAVRVAMGKLPEVSELHRRPAARGPRGLPRGRLYKSGPRASLVTV